MKLQVNYDRASFIQPLPAPIADFNRIGARFAREMPCEKMDVFVLDKAVLELRSILAELEP